MYSGGTTPLMTPDGYNSIAQAGDGNDQHGLPHGNNKSGYETNLYLYSEELEDRPRISTLIGSLANYSNTIPTAAAGDPDAAPPAAPAPRMGTLIGVFLPCIQNIFGVILFIRLTWVVGTAGAIQGFLIVLICCCATMLTAISMSAIATNGVVPAGGSYFMISRSLGPECGGAVGMLFYTGTTLAAAMYIVGAVEIVLTYMAPSMSIFGDFTKDANAMYNNFRVYGTGLLLVMGTIVFIGVKFVNKFATVALACVILSITAVYVGIFVNIDGNDKLPMCVLGKRLLKDIEISHCNKTSLDQIYCVNGTCDPYYNMHNLSIVQGIKGLSSGVFFDNLGDSFLNLGQYIAYGKEPEDIEQMERPTYNQVYADLTTTFTILIGIFFPSVTGIMAGSNRSGDLADAQKSIPIGTICAIITTSLVYLSSVLLFAGTVDNLLLRDKFGQSIGGKLVVANIAWPNQWVILIGSFLSTLGAGLQSLTGAPRLLQAIAKDEIVPFLAPFAVSSKRGEPTRALLLTMAICQCGILLGNVDILAPLLSMFFLMCYGFVNLACALQTLLKTPNWRPRFKYYHWSLSLAGLGLCISIMFMTSWFYALIAMGMAIVIYKYIEYRGAEKEWGDGLRGVALSAARYSLLRLEEGPPHTKNWRPQILILSKLTDDLVPKYKKMFSFASQLKAGKGLTICVSVVGGDYTRLSGEASAARSNLRTTMDEERVKGFCDVLVSSSISEGLSHFVQTIGLGGLKPNTVIVGWPYRWRQSEDDRSWHVFQKWGHVEGLCHSVQTIRLGGLKPNTVIVGWPYRWRQSEDDRSWHVFQNWGHVESFCHSVQTIGFGGLKPNTVIVGWPYRWRQSEDDRSWHVFQKWGHVEGLCHSVQTIGLGGLKPNTVIVGWPYRWRQSEDDRSWHVFQNWGHVEGLCHSVQTIGLGGLKPNTVIVGWPYRWRQSEDDRSWHVFQNWGHVEGLCHSVQTIGLGGLKPNTVIVGWPYRWRQSEDDRSWHVFQKWGHVEGLCHSVQTIRLGGLKPNTVIVGWPYRWRQSEDDRSWHVFQNWGHVESFCHSVQTIGFGGLKPNTVIVGWPYRWRQSEDDRSWHVFQKWGHVEGLCHSVQTIRLGGLKPNTVIVGWPYRWRQSEDDRSWHVFQNWGHVESFCHSVQTIGFGGLKPNTVIVGWPYRWRQSEDDRSGHVFQNWGHVESLCHSVQAIGFGGLKPNTVIVGWPYRWRQSEDDRSGHVFQNWGHVESLCHSVQTIGLGGLKPNTVIVGWPYRWRQSEDDRSWHVFQNWGHVEGLCHSVQTIGLGGLKPNTVIVGWPYRWRQSEDDRSWHVFQNWGHVEGLCHSVQTIGLGGLKPNTVIVGWPYRWRQSEDDRSWHVFLQTVRSVSAARMAMLVPKGINFFPDSTEKVSGNIDVWWIVHDGGMLMLLPFLLRQHRTWKNCKMRIFTVAQMEDNSIQMKKDLKMFLYHLRIEAEVEVVEMVDSDISAYTYERTLMMEQRNQMLRELRLNKRETLGVVQAIIDNHHADVKTATKVRFAEPGGDKEGVASPHPNHQPAPAAAAAPASAAPAAPVTPPSPPLTAEDSKEDFRSSLLHIIDSMWDSPDETSQCDGAVSPPLAEEQNEVDKKPDRDDDGDTLQSERKASITPDEGNVRRMHTAVKLNEVIVSRSHDAQLVILNLPGPPRDTKIERESNYMEFLEVLTEGLEKVLMVRGGGREVITIYS